MSLNSEVAIALPTHAGKPIHWTRLHGDAQAWAIAQAVTTAQGPIIVITPDNLSAARLRHSCQFFLGEQNAQLPHLTLPDWETLPYDHFSPHQDIISERLQTLAQLLTLQRGLLIVPIATALQRLPPKRHVQQGFSLAVKQKLSLDTFRRQLVDAGYYAVSQVMAHGEFSVRGALLDCFPMGSPLPIRIDLFDEEIESIRQFDPEDQRTIDKLDSVSFLPAYEFPMTEVAIARFRSRWRQLFSGDATQCPIYQNISAGRLIGGVEYYLPLFFENIECLFDYISESATFIVLDKVHDAAQSRLQEIQERYEQRRGDITRPILAPEQLYFKHDDFFNRLKQYPQIRVHAGETQQKPNQDFTTLPLPDLAVNAHALDNRFAKLRAFLLDNEQPSLICAETLGRVDQLQKMLTQENFALTNVATWEEFRQTTPTLALTKGTIYSGYINKESDYTMISENDLFGEPVYQTTNRQAKAIDPDSLFKNLAELNIGSPVVHQNHGVGRYAGLVTLTVSDEEQEFLLLEYANADKLYVPVACLDMISRYSGVDLENAPLHRLGGPEWDKMKKRAAKRAHDVAAELLELYAIRATREGYAFTLDNHQFSTFCQEFPFEETPDQAKAISNVVEDMRKPTPMDRLICGDVGFGKTEVAMRAAFVAAMNGKQVAILVPTTLLAQQHYQTFCDRFANWPIRIGVLSRLSTAREQQATIKQVQAGTIDIVIGTHKLLQPDIKFRSLQLVIIDEEHRFGVRQKEKLKSLRAEVDILSLTATPIPRTLNMAMAGVRDLSIIGTPPARRLAIRTFVHEYDAQLIKEALQREILRGGQVFYLHNDIDTLPATVERIRKIMPEAKIAYAHGQMRERELERVMSAFYHQQYHILVCTTIIENGIDIPTANTMIIERADRFGLAQLHQLRGRVGRSHHQAYAYLITPPFNVITRDAQKRLEAIAQLEDLGVGFSLATLDLEIRGAGDFLGEGQSGQFEEIGFTLYQELLELAVKALKSGKHPDEITLSQKTELHFPVPTLIPAPYIPDIHTRLVLYKRLASVQDEQQLQDLRMEMIDRFGRLPEATEDLFTLTQLKIACQPLGIKKVDIGHQYGRIEFYDNTPISPRTIIHLIQTQPKQYQFAGQNILRFYLGENHDKKGYTRLASVLTALRTT